MNQKSALQFAIAVAGLVPVTAGALGVFQPALLAVTGAPSALTHVAYLSGLLLGIGLGYWSLIPSVERQGSAFGLLTAIVVLGGVARLILAVRLNAWGLSVIAPLAMELAVTPVLWAWQRQLSGSSNSGWE